MDAVQYFAATGMKVSYKILFEFLSRVNFGN